MPYFHTPDAMLDAAWRLLLNGAVKKHDPLRTPVIGTTDGQQAQLRTVVLRRVDITSRRLYFYTDIRAGKVAQLQQNSSLSALFYHPRQQFQIRTLGQVNLHHQDAVAQDCWQRLPVAGRKNYATTLAPGTPTPLSVSGLPEGWSSDMPLAQSEFAFAHFVVMICEVGYIDCLQLHAEHSQRAAFKWEHGGWSAAWLIP